MATGTLPFRGESSAVIFKAILDSTPTSTVRLNPDVPAELERIINRALEKDRNLRYQHASEMRAEMQRLKRDSDSGRIAAASSAKVEVTSGPISQTSSPSSAPISAPISPAAARSPASATGTPAVVAPRRMLWKVSVPAAGLVVVLIAGGLYFRSAQAAKLTEKDTVVLADFANTTGDPVFDGTLKQALAVDLDQSPFLRVVPPARIQKTLTFMGRSPDERLTTDLARDLCLRVGSKAMLSGSIASLGTQYILTLNAVNCRAVTPSHSSRRRPPAKSKCSPRSAAPLRNCAARWANRWPPSKILMSHRAGHHGIARCAEGLCPENAEFDRGRAMASLPFYRRAVELEPNLAWVYARMGTVYANAGELEPAREYTRKAYELKDRVSEREKLYIAEHYYQTVTGELDKEIETLELYDRTYPSDSVPGNNLGCEADIVMTSPTPVNIS